MQTTSIILAIFVFTSVTWAEKLQTTPLAPSGNIKTLINDLPKPEALGGYQRIVWEGPGKHTDETVANAKRRIDKARETVPALRKMLVVGTSILAYPGLIAHGNITYLPIGDVADPFSPSPEPKAPTEWGYELHLGIPAIGGEGPHGGDFVVVFDSSGLIREIKEQRSLKN